MSQWARAVVAQVGGKVPTLGSPRVLLGVRLEAGCHRGGPQLRQLIQKTAKPDDVGKVARQLEADFAKPLALARQVGGSSLQNGLKRTARRRPKTLRKSWENVPTATAVHIRGNGTSRASGTGRGVS